MHKTQKHYRTYQFPIGTSNSNDSVNCGCCNWRTSKGYVRSTSLNEAKAFLQEVRNNGGNAQCGECYSEMLSQYEELE